MKLRLRVLLPWYRGGPGIHETLVARLKPEAGAHLRLAVLSSILAVSCGAREPMTVGEVETAITQGISHAAVEQFFRDNKITYSVVDGEDLALESDVPAEATHRYLAVVRDVGRWLLIYEESIVIEVDFGAEDKAIHVKVYKSLTGP